MRITIVAVGRARAGPMRALYEEYADRCGWPVSLREVEAKGSGSAPEVQAREADLLLAGVPKGARTVVLDERGRGLSSRDFAARLSAFEDGGVGDLAILVGGADGHTDAVRGAADLLLSLGPMTWPHLLVRVLLAEQLFRARRILDGHPYHRD